MCSHTEKSHGSKAECDFCEYVGVVTTTRANELACPDCRAKIELGTLNPVNNATVAVAKEVDARIQVRTDLFNAATVAIIDLKKSIDTDESIVNKPYVLAQTLMERFTHFKQVIFAANETIVDASNNQKAIQVYLNQLANQLRTEEREKLKIADINYQPTSVKPISKPKPIKTTGTSKKIDKAEVRKVCAELGIPEMMLQMILVAKPGLSVIDAGRQVKATIDAAKKQAGI